MRHVSFAFSLLAPLLACLALLLAGCGSGETKAQPQNDMKAAASNWFADMEAAEKAGETDAAVAICRKAAEQGVVSAQWILGSRYFRGAGVKQSYAEAAKWFRMAAETGHAGAQFALGDMYATGHGLPQDNAQALHWWQLSAKNGDSGAMFNLGLAYRDGQMAPRDQAASLAWLELAVKHGNPYAQYELAVMHRDGVGAPQNLMRAAELFTLAAERDHTGAQAALGQMYFKGQGVAQDPVMASMWFSLAAEGGDKASQLSRNIIAPTLSSAQLAQVDEMKARWKAEHLPGAVPPQANGDKGKDSHGGAKEAPAKGGHG